MSIFLFFTWFIHISHRYSIHANKCCCCYITRNTLFRNYEGNEREWPLAVHSQSIQSKFEFTVQRCRLRHGLDRFGEAGEQRKAKMSKANGGKQTSTGSVGVDLGAVSRFKTAVVAVITGCSLARCGSGWVRGWVLGTWSGKSLLCFLVEIHLSWLSATYFFHFPS